MSEPPSSRLLGHRGFVLFWVADGVSNLGTFVSGLAVQLLLIETLGADQQEVGLVRSAQWLPYLLFGLLAGVLVDRVRRKPLLVGADALSAVLFGGVGVLALTGHLSVGLLAAVVFVVGSASMVSSAANQSYLPSLVPAPLLPVANARLHQTYTAAQSVGPLVAGLLVRALSAPVAVLVDALSYAVSAVVVAGIRDGEREPDRPASPSASRRQVLAELREGAAWVYRHETLRPYAISLHTWFLGNGLVGTLLVFFATTELGLGPVAVGLVLAVAGVSGVVGAGLAPRLGDRFGVGPVMVASQWLSPIGFALLLLAQPGPSALLWPVVANLVVGLGMGAGDPLGLSHRTTVTPDRLRGRMNATIRSFNWGTLAVAAPLAGWLATSFGNRSAIAAGIVVLAVSAVVLTASPVRRVRTTAAPGEHTEQ
ncbi:Na+/melibiose symporter-like transporter [Terracoccus luteus]|uniref:Na+/melibiose symporter-like transporter n=1 Tax=Terracoccus luteus TaxID=53356 RepID=A0A495XQ48_9MICO|nr:MFS transporter [Terracoccus luteus]RKT76650.1 Na+/melibiose symporter-like transporter [Terracoccus luteus]